MSTVQETPEDKKKRARAIVRLLHRAYPDAHCALVHHSDWQLLISTILSAQSTDETVNRVTAELYRKYRGPEEIAAAPRSEIEKAIHATGFFRQKAKNIQAACAMIVHEFDGRVPDTLEDLTRMPGVARKTANVVLGTWFGRNEGVVVDTHVGRVSGRLGLWSSAADPKDAVKIERDLMAVVPRKEWTFFSHAVIWHGRRVCRARKPACADCILNKLCPAAFTFDGAKSASSAAAAAAEAEAPAVPAAASIAGRAGRAPRAAAGKSAARQPAVQARSKNPAAGRPRARRRP